METRIVFYPYLKGQKDSLTSTFQLLMPSKRDLAMQEVSITSQPTSPSSIEPNTEKANWLSSTLSSTNPNTTMMTMHRHNRHIVCKSNLLLLSSNLSKINAPLMRKIWWRDKWVDKSRSWKHFEIRATNFTMTKSNMWELSGPG